MPFFVYILQCSDQTLYVGSTNDLEKRLHAHNNLKSGAHYTKIRRPVTLVYSETCETFAESRSKEAEFKKLSRTEKLTIIKNSKKKKHPRITKKIIPKKSTKKSKTK
jgi:putative endonuclease